jgi:hypothetical protein
MHAMEKLRSLQSGPFAAKGGLVLVLWSVRVEAMRLLEGCLVGQRKHVA